MIKIFAGKEGENICWKGGENKRKGGREEVIGGKQGERGERRFKQILTLKGINLLRQIPIVCLFHSSKIDCNSREENNENYLLVISNEASQFIYT